MNFTQLIWKSLHLGILAVFHFDWVELFHHCETTWEFELNRTKEKKKSERANGRSVWKRLHVSREAKAKMLQSLKFLWKFLRSGFFFSRNTPYFNNETLYKNIWGFLLTKPIPKISITGFMFSFLIPSQSKWWQLNVCIRTRASIDTYYCKCFLWNCKSVLLKICITESAYICLHCVFIYQISCIQGSIKFWIHI